MKLSILLVFIVASFSSFGQNQSSVNNQTNTRLFAQCMFSIETQEEIDALQFEIYSNNPNVEMVRLDLITQRALFITANIESLTEVEFASWFGNYGDDVECVQIGVYGVDVMNSFPFTNCQ